MTEETTPQDRAQQDHAKAVAYLEYSLATELARGDVRSMGAPPTLSLKDVAVEYHPASGRPCRHVRLEFAVEGSHFLAADIAVACVLAAKTVVSNRAAHGLDSGGE